jgi:hypothetical protein
MESKTRAAVERLAVEPFVYFGQTDGKNFTPVKRGNCG